MVIGLLEGLSPVSLAASNAKSLYEAGNFSGAQQAFAEELRGDQDSPERAFNLGTAAYKNQKWPEAIEAFGKALNSRDPQLRKQAEYNLANTLVQQARQGRRGEDKNAMQQAIAHYDAALNRDPSFEDAKHNRDFVTKLLEAKPPQQQKQDKGEKSEKKDQKNKDDKDKQQEQKENQSDQSKEGEGQQKQDGDQGEGKEGDGQQKQDGSKGQQPKKDGQQTAQNGQQPEPVQEKPGDEKERGELKDSPLVDRPEEAAKRER
jgi:Ca-activated chloride channel family protein